MTYQERIADIRQQGGINFHFPVMKRGGVKPGVWNHICVSYESAKRHLVYIHNGVIQLNYTNAPLAFEVKDGLLKSVFSPAFRDPDHMYTSPTWDPKCVQKKGTFWVSECEEKQYMRNKGRVILLYTFHTVGFVTDKNFWSRPLSIQEMVDWTTCKSFAKGDLLPWNRDDWTPVQRDEEGNPVNVHDDVVVDSESFCASPSPNKKTYTMFADNIYPFDKGFLLCKQFGGTMAHTRTLEEDDIVRGYIQSLGETSSAWKDVLDVGIWYRYRDDDVGGVWQDPETGFIASFMNCRDDPADCYGVIGWNLVHEPEGGLAENCVAGLQTKKREFSSYDITCDQEYCIICEETSKEIKLRGLCSLSKIGKKYLMAPEPSGKRRYFSGYTGWTLEYKNDEWTLTHATITDTVAKYTDSKHYPMGRHTWKVTNDVCSGMAEGNRDYIRIL